MVLGKRGEHAKWGRDLLGSTAEAVTKRSAVPVLLVEEKARPLKKALVLFDGSEPAEPRSASGRRPGRARLRWS